MPTQLQLEGPELEPLLARVRAEHGSSARIVQAEKVRTGGVGGFFAKAHFEITVELEDALPPAPQPITSLLDLADQVSAGERAAAISTESTGFAAVLARLGATAGEAEDPPHPVVPQQRQATSPRTPRARRAPAPAPTPAAAPAPVAPVRRTPAPGTSVAPRPAGAGTTAVRTVRPPAASVVRPVAGSAVAVRRPAAVAVRPRAEVVPAAAPPQRRTAVARSSGTLAVAARRAEPPVALDVPAQLIELGLPAHLLPTVAGDRLHAALVEALRALPVAPPTNDRAGNVLVLAGPLPLAAEVARQVARELDLPRSSIVSGGPGMRTPEQARDRRATWSRRSRTTLVVLETPLTAAGALRSRALLDALEPTTTWGVVEATRKPRDVGAWARAVGHVDALALTGVDETADPAAVLQLGIPVARLGSRKATAAVWAGLLTDRVAA